MQFLSKVMKYIDETTLLLKCKSVVYSLQARLLMNRPSMLKVL